MIHSRSGGFAPSGSSFSGTPEAPCVSQTKTSTHKLEALQRVNDLVIRLDKFVKKLLIIDCMNELDKMVLNFKQILSMGTNKSVFHDRGMATLCIDDRLQQSIRLTLRQFYSCLLYTSPSPRDRG